MGDLLLLTLPPCRRQGRFLGQRSPVSDDWQRDSRPVLTVTTTDMPGTIRFSKPFVLGRSKRIFTGTRWTILVKLPVALSDGKRAKVEPEPGDRLSTVPANLWCGKESTFNSAGCPGRMCSSCVSLKLATTQASSDTTVINGCPGCTRCPTSTDFLPTRPEVGATIFV